MRSFISTLFLAACSLCQAGAADGAAKAIDLSKLPPAATAPVDFARDIQPLLADRCVKCHGPEKQKGGLRLDAKAQAMQGGDDGKIIEPGKSAESRMIHLVAGLEEDTVMPPKDKGERFTAAQIGLLRAWIDQGASWPDDGKVAKLRSDHWSLQPLKTPAPPVVPGAVTPLDAFVQAKLAAKGLALSPEADPRTLIRRVTFDLTGLPPTPEEVEAFVESYGTPKAHESHPSYRALVDRLLASPRYGERWGRHWLDVARYTESQGFEYDRLRENAWHYRDYVIRSFNADKPYDLFMREQVAGDVLEPVTTDGMLGPSLLVCGPWDQAGNAQANATQKKITREDELEDLLGVVGQTFLGLTVNCARCHAHKFDPIPHEDYYRMKAVFEGVKHGSRDIAKADAQEPAAKNNERRAELQKAIAASAKMVAEIEAAGAKLAAAQRPATAPAPESAAAAFRAGDASISPEEILAALTAEQRTAREVALADGKKLSAALESLPPVKPPRRETSYVGTRIQPAPTKRLVRGDVLAPAEVVTPGALSAVFVLESDFGLPADAPEAQRRLKFADWLADARNPLPARVLVNRVWQLHFGQGLVSTANDFGASGARPTHPELLDWLAGKFIASGWSVKALHRLILDSATYRQSPVTNEKAAALDADNTLLWRFPPRRLEAEAVRDAMLAVSGQLDLQMGGPSFKGASYANGGKGAAESNRRTVYRMNVNSGKDPLLDAFDCPDPAVKTPRRGVTITPLQALGLMNNAFVQRQAQSLAERALKASGKDLAAAIQTAYRLALSRPPTAAETQLAQAAAQERGLASVCWALLNSTEFVYVQ